MKLSVRSRIFCHKEKQT